METTIESPTSWKRVIKATYSPDEIKQKLNQKIQKYSTQLRLPGFRPGKAPVGLVKARFGEAIKEELVEELTNEAYKQSLEENKLTPVSRGNATPSNLEEGQEFNVNIEVEVLPDFELKKYSGFHITSKYYEVTDKDIQEYIDQIRLKFANYIPVDRGIKDKDYVIIEYKLEDEEKPQEEPVLMNRTQNPELFDSLKGASVGKTRRIKITYPQNYKNESKAGTTEEIEAKILEVKEPELPELNQDFLKLSNLNFETVDDFKADVRKKLETYNKRQERSVLENAVVEELIKANPLDVPPTLELEATNQIIGQHMDIRKLSEEQLTDLRGKFREAGQKMIQKELLINRIIEKEKISASREEVNEEVKQIAEESNLDFNKLYMDYRNKGILKNIKEEIKQKKAIDFILEKSKLKKEKVKDKK